MIRAAATPLQTSRVVFQIACNCKAGRPWLPVQQSLFSDLLVQWPNSDAVPASACCLQKKPAAPFSRKPILLLVLLNEGAVVRDCMHLHHSIMQSEYNHPSSPFLIWICSNSQLEGYFFPNDSISEHLSLFYKSLLSRFYFAEASWARLTSAPREAINSSPFRLPSPLRFEQPTQKFWAQKLSIDIREISLQEFLCEILSLNWLRDQLKKDTDYFQKPPKNTHAF